MSLLARVVAQLQGKGTPHALIGAAALGLHGVTRATDDVDLFTTDLAPLDAGFWSAESKELSIDLRRGRADDPLAGVVRISDGVSALDLVVGKHRWQVLIQKLGPPGFAVRCRWIGFRRDAPWLLAKAFEEGAETPAPGE